MNPLNYATLEASRRLVKAGIVLETEAYWLFGQIKKRWFLSYEKRYQLGEWCIPAPSMAELWRELPPGTILVKEPEGISAAHQRKIAASVKSDTNPADALIDLLIWVRKSNETLREDEDEHIQKSK